MLKIVYDPVNGNTVPDLQIEEYIQKKIEMEKEFGSLTVAVGSCVLIDAFRLAVANKQINSQDIVFEFNGKAAEICDCGMLAPGTDYPVTYVNMITELLKTKLKRSCQGICQKVQNSCCKSNAK